MNGVLIAESVLSLIAGVGIFLIACTMLSTNLEALGSGKLKAMFAKTSNSKLAGVGVGTAATVAIQSSSATTVMVIGFVNAGIMTLSQAATVIFGANIGTTVTGQLVALGMFGGSVSASAVFAALAGVGAFITAFAKRDRLLKLGGILAGFGMLFAGLSMMSGAMGHFSEMQSVKSFLSAFENAFLLVLAGAVLTALVQSSSVMTSMAITMVVTGLISLNQGIYITMGSNVGTCVTALIAGLTSTKNAKRTSLIHLIFNVSGVAVFMVIGGFMRLGGVDFGFVFEKMFPHAPQVQLAMFHTVFNIATVAVVLPLTGLLVKLVTKLVPDGKGDEKRQPRFDFLEEHMLKTPAVAVQQLKKEIIAMSEGAVNNFYSACEMICTQSYDGLEKFRAAETRLDFLNKELAGFIAKLLKAGLGERDTFYLSTAIRSVSDLERVGDYAENTVEYAERLSEKGEKFSAEAVAEIRGLKELVSALYKEVVKAYKDLDRAALERALKIEERVDEVTAKMLENHIERINGGRCSPEAGAQYLSFAAGAERVADHFINVAKAQFV